MYYLLKKANGKVEGKKLPSRNKLMNKWLTGISKRCKLPEGIDMKNKNHVLGGERC